MKNEKGKNEEKGIIEKKNKGKYADKEWEEKDYIDEEETGENKEKGAVERNMITILIRGKA